MTGSAYQAMDVLCDAKASYQRRVQRGDCSHVLTLPEAGGLLQNAIYIYIRKLNFLGSLFWTNFGGILERF